MIRGFTGKIPARGDFVHCGLPRAFIDPWYDWQSSVIAGSRALMGETWLDAFLEAPIWRFVLPPGLCGRHAAIGLMMPSVDKVGRYFPLTFAALCDAGTPDPDNWKDWLDAAEQLGWLALDDDAGPDRLMPPLPSVTQEGGGQTVGVWWTDGGPRVLASHWSLASLPDASRFAAMLGHLTQSESA